jgi:hypothetical protein
MIPMPAKDCKTVAMKVFDLSAHHKIDDFRRINAGALTRVKYVLGPLTIQALRFLFCIKVAEPEKHFVDFVDRVNLRIMHGAGKFFVPLGPGWLVAD